MAASFARGQMLDGMPVQSSYGGVRLVSTFGTGPIFWASPVNMGADIQWGRTPSVSMQARIAGSSPSSPLKRP